MAEPAPGSAPGSGSRGDPRENPRWPAAPPWHETREEFEDRVAEYRRRETILARHSIHVVSREVDSGFRLRTDGRPGIWAANRRAAYACDARGMAMRFDQASDAIQYAWEYVLPPEAREPAVGGTREGGGQPAEGAEPAAGDAH
jgi:hypothetical protein